jgi:hypothetical protein
MKPYGEFKPEALQELMRKNGMTRHHGNVKHKTQADNGEIYDYVKLAKIFGCKDRQARHIVHGRQRLQRYHYDLLAFHTGSIEPGKVVREHQVS